MLIDTYVGLARDCGAKIHFTSKGFKMLENNGDSGKVSTEAISKIQAEMVRLYIANQDIFIK